MDSRVPLPTDNIYKFYALFGLVLLIFGVGAMLVLNRNTNAFMAQALLDLEAVKVLDQPSPVEQTRRALLERQMVVARDDKNHLTWLLAFLVALGFWGSIYGFFVWHRRIQPIEDELRALQRDKLRLEVKKMQVEAEPPTQSGISLPDSSGTNVTH